MKTNLQSDLKTPLPPQAFSESEGESFELVEIIDIPVFQELIDHFYHLTHIPLAILDLKGRILVGAGWQEICDKYHQAHPTSCPNCQRQDSSRGLGASYGDFKIHMCKNGIWNAATPIRVDGCQVGNLFAGQFLCADEMPHREQYLDPAGSLGGDKQDYLEALGQVPVLNREKLRVAMNLLVKLAEVLSQLGDRNLKLARTLTRSQHVAKALKRMVLELTSTNQLQLLTQAADPYLREQLFKGADVADRQGESIRSNLNGTAEKHLEQVAQEARRLQTQIDTLLACARADAPQCAWEPTGSREALILALAGLQPLILNLGAVIEYGELPPVRADIRQLALIFENLVSNALIFHGPAAPHVRVVARRFENDWIFCVADNGIGIEPSDKQRIFQPFQRLNPSRPGAGLGLAICQRIIERHAGRIWVQAQPSQGSRFFFRIPARE